MKRPALVGILNVTPDSFSNDGVLGSSALARAAQMVRDGADILDIGAESTRPGADVIGEEEEWNRLGPLLERVIDQPWRADVRLSIDTRHAVTAGRALNLGVDIINDVGGLRDHAMLEILSGGNCDCVVMHALSVPADPKVVWDSKTKPVPAILEWKREVTARAVTAGIAPERLIYDPGLGFGKTPEQSLELLLDAHALVASGGRWLFGHSRKSFLTLFTDAPANERDALTLAFSMLLAKADVPYLRVHDIAGHQAMFGRLCM